MTHARAQTNGYTRTCGHTRTSAGSRTSVREHRSPYGELLLVTGPATTHARMVGGKAMTETVMMRWVEG